MSKSLTAKPQAVMHLEARRPRCPALRKMHVGHVVAVIWIRDISQRCCVLLCFDGSLHCVDPWDQTPRLQSLARYLVAGLAARPMLPHSFQLERSVRQMCGVLSK